MAGAPDVTRLEYRLVDVFTRARFGGNPLAVFPDAHDVEPARMQRIAFELNLSETTFVVPTARADCDVRVRIFTPRAELPMAGHPTVGTAFVLDALGRIAGDRVVFEEGVGPIPVARERHGAETRWCMTQPRPRFGAVRGDRAQIAAAFSLAADDLDPALPIECVATGPPVLIVPLRSLDALGRARVRAELWDPIERELAGALPYLFARTGDSRARCRMFAPSQGIPEDPATGAAAGPLGAYSLAHGLLDGTRLVLAQGVELGRPSELHVEVEGAGREIQVVRVAGSCAAQGGGWFDA